MAGSKAPKQAKVTSEMRDFVRLLKERHIIKNVEVEE